MKTIVFLLTLLVSSASYACDVCGCSIAGGGFGLLSGTTQHFVGIGYSHLKYTNLESPVIDHFHRLQINAQAQLSNRWRIQTLVPFVYNLRYDQRESRLSASGLGDIQVLTSYALADRMLTKGGRLLITAGGGLSLPTGVFDRQIFRKPLPEDFNPGTGALGFIGELRAQASQGTFGVLSIIRYQHFNANEAAYQFGDRWVALAKIFKRFAFKELALVPVAGIEYANIAPNVRAETRVALHGSGGRSFNFSTGIQAERNSYVLGLETVIPLNQTFGNGDAQASPRLDLVILKKF